jgi:hypothetical protein
MKRALYFDSLLGFNLGINNMHHNSDAQVSSSILRRRRRRKRKNVKRMKRGMDKNAYSFDAIIRRTEKFKLIFS